jgi:hypothetical protein
MATPLSKKRQTFVDFARKHNFGPKVKRKALLEFAAEHNIPVPWWITNDLSLRAGEHGYYMIPGWEDVEVSDEADTPTEDTKAVDTADTADAHSDEALDVALDEAVAGA